MANIEFKTLEQFMPYWCQKILPAVYDDSLSYYQLLGRILQKYNEVIEIVNKHSETLVDHENRITAAEAQIELNRQQIEALKAALAELEKQVEQNTENISKLSARVDGHDEAIAAIQAFITELTNSTSEHLFNIDTTANTITFSVKSTPISYQSAIDTLIKRGAQVMKGAFVGGSVAIGAFQSSSTTGRIFGYVIGVENNELHYATFVANTNADNANTGKISSWKSTELLDITSIKQSLGTGEYDLISQKVLTDVLNGKLSTDMGISGATAGSYINIAEVDTDGKPIKYGFGTPGGGGSGVDIVQTTGQSTTSVMSQNATTVELNKKTDISLGTTGATVGQNIRVKTVSGGKPTAWETYTPETPDADVSLGITGAETGDLAVVKTTGTNGAPNSWSPISSDELAQAMNSSYIDLGSYTGHSPEPSGATETFDITMPTAWIGKTRSAVMNLIKNQRFRLYYSRLYTAYNVTEYANLILSNGSIIGESSGTSGVLNVRASTYVDYTTGWRGATIGTSKIRCCVYFQTTDTDLSKTVTATDKLQCYVSTKILG